MQPIFQRFRSGMLAVAIDLPQEVPVVVAKHDQKGKLFGDGVPAGGFSCEKHRHKSDEMLDDRFFGA